MKKILFIIYLFFSVNHIYASCPLPKCAENQNFYSQFFEDYILSIVFEDIPYGTYIDVGAYSPDLHSVTNFFYKKGWNGINIEPIYSRYEELSKARQRDVNFNVAISDQKTVLNFYHILDGEGLSTFDEKLFDNAKKQGFQYRIEQVQVMTLNQILELFPLPMINFLKLDIEGFEKFALRGIDFSKYRPQVLIIEATYPEEWDPLLVNNGYIFVMSDGLNFYYLAQECYEQFKDKFFIAFTCANQANEQYKVWMLPMSWGRP